MKDNFAVRVILILLAAAILFVLITQYNTNSKQVMAERFHPNTPTQRRRSPVYQESIPSEFRGRGHAFGRLRNAAATAGRETFVDEPSPTMFAPQQQIPTDANDVRPIEPVSNEQYRAISSIDGGELQQSVQSQYPRDRITSVEELLPRDAANSKWAQVNPAGQGDVKDQNFLSAGFHIGVNSVGQSNRNPNLNLRSEPPNPRIEGLSPWHMSTIEPDNSRRHFELGEA